MATETGQNNCGLALHRYGYPSNDLPAGVIRFLMLPATASPNHKKSHDADP